MFRFIGNNSLSRISTNINSILRNSPIHFIRFEYHLFRDSQIEHNNLFLVDRPTADRCCPKFAIFCCAIWSDPYEMRTFCQLSVKFERNFGVYGVIFPSIKQIKTIKCPYSFINLIHISTHTNSVLWLNAVFLWLDCAHKMNHDKTRREKGKICIVLSLSHQHMMRTKSCTKHAKPGKAGRWRNLNLEYSISLRFI